MIDKELFKEYIEKGYESISAVASGGLSFPYAMADFEKMFKSAFYEKVCGEQIRTKYQSTCQLEIAEKGLETIAIYILESSRKKMIILENSRLKEEKAKEIISSKDMEDLGKKYYQPNQFCLILLIFFIFRFFLIFLEKLVSLVNSLFEGYSSNSRSILQNYFHCSTSSRIS